MPSPRRRTISTSRVRYRLHCAELQETLSGEAFIRILAPHVLAYALNRALCPKSSSDNGRSRTVLSRAHDDCAPSMRADPQTSMSGMQGYLWNVYTIKSADSLQALHGVSLPFLRRD